MTHSLKLVTLPDCRRQRWIQPALNLGLFIIRILGLFIIRVFCEAQLCTVTSHHLSVMFPCQVGAFPYAGLSWEGRVAKRVGSFMPRVV